jgi:hypothetical protein
MEMETRDEPQVSDRRGVSKREATGCAAGGDSGGRPVVPGVTLGRIVATRATSAFGFGEAAIEKNSPSQGNSRGQIGGQNASEPKQIQKQDRDQGAPFDKSS